MSTNGDRKDIPEKFEWKCSLCPKKGKAATKADADLLLDLHVLSAHKKEPK